MKTLFQHRFEEALQKIATKLKKPGGNKSLSKIHERIGRVRERHSRISGRYDINVISSSDGASAIGIEWRLLPEKMQDKLTGKYFLRTSIKDRNAKHARLLFKQ